MNESQGLTYWAESKNWNLFSPDWEYFSQIPTLPLIDLLALYIGMDPVFVHCMTVVHLDWLMDTAIPLF